MRNHVLLSSLLASAASFAAASPATASPAPTSASSSSTPQQQAIEANQLSCLSTRAAELSAAASCAGKSQSKLHTCLADLTALDSLESCFTQAGCPASAAEWAIAHCSTPADPNNPHDLRRHPQPLAAIPTVAPAFVVPLFGRQVTASSSPSPCFTDKTVTITQCTSIGGSKSCGPSPSPSAVCREELICRTDNQGNPSCMFKQSSMGVAGIIIAIIFATALVISIFGICFFCCKERKEQQRLEKAAEAAKIAKEAKAATAAAKRPGRNVTGGVGEIGGGQSQGQPLMYEGGDVGAGGQAGGPGGQGYGSGANPFADSR